MRPVPAHLYPFTGHFHSVGGHSMHYLDEGSGPPVVMLHGNPTWSFYYRELVRALAPTHRCIVPDHIGMGLSDKPPADRYPYTLARRIEDVRELLEALGVTQDITLVVHDWGGMIGMGWAVEHADAIARLVILNTAAFPLPSGRSFHLPLRFTRTPLGGWLTLHANAFAEGATWTCVKRRRMSRELRRAYTAPYDTAENRIATLRFVQDIPLGPRDEGYEIVSRTAERLHHFADTPTRIFWGQRDFVFDEPFLREWERYLPHAEVTRFPDCGHYVLEDAAEEIVSGVRRFLEVP